MKLKWLAPLLSLSLIGVVQTGAAADPIVFKMGHKSSPLSSWHQGCERFKSLVESRTKGGIKVDIYPSGQLGDQRTMTEAAQMGVVDIVLDAPAILVNFIPAMGVFDLPFLFKDYAHAHKVLDTIGMEMDGKLQESGLKLLSNWETGFKRLSNNVRPITSLEDIKGLKIRVPGSPVLLATIKAIGANPIAISWPETYIALQTGTADGQFNPPDTMQENKIEEVQKYYSNNLTIQYGAEPVVMSLMTWKKLSPEYQKIVQTAAEEAKVYQREVAARMDTEALESMKKKGIEVNLVSDELLETLMKMTAPVREKYASKPLLDRIAEMAK